MAYFSYLASLYFLVSVMLKSYLVDTCFLSVFGCLSLIKHLRLSYEKLNLIILSFGGTEFYSFFLTKSLDFLDLMPFINLEFV